MGQYHKTVNLDNKEWLNPHKLGDVLKLREQCGWSPGGINDTLHLLLAVSNGRGGGDFQSGSPFIGSWGGDRIAVIGDYAEPDDLPNEDADTIYDQLDKEGSSWKDITDDLIPVLEREYGVVYCGDNWRDRVCLWDIPNMESTYGNGDRIAVIHGREYRISWPRTAVKEHLARGGKIADFNPKVFNPIE